MLVVKIENRENDPDTGPVNGTIGKQQQQQQQKVPKRNSQNFGALGSVDDDTDGGGGLKIINHFFLPFIAQN